MNLANKASAESIRVVCRFRGGQEENSGWKFNEDGISMKAPSVIPGQQSGRVFTFDRILDAGVS